MADFTIDVSRSKTSRINLGIQGENIIEHIIFNISSWIEEFGEGVAYIYAQRKGDENPYPVALDMDLDAGTATWTITDADTAIKGKGKAQLVFVSDDEDSITDVEVYSSSSTYSVGDYCLYGTQLYKCKTTISTAEAWTPAHWDAVNEVKKTRVYATTVQASLVSTSSENPDAYETWLEVLGGYTARIEAAEEDLEDYVQNNTIADVTINSTSIVEDRVAEIPLASSSGHGAMSSTDKAKLDGIEAGAEVNVQADWNQTDTTKDDYIKNKPTIPTVPVNDVQINGTSILNNNVANISAIHTTGSGGYGVVPNPPLPASSGDVRILTDFGWKWAAVTGEDMAANPTSFALNSAIKDYVDEHGGGGGTPPSFEITIDDDNKECTITNATEFLAALRTEHPQTIFIHVNFDTEESGRAVDEHYFTYFVQSHPEGSGWTESRGYISPLFTDTLGITYITNESGGETTEVIGIKSGYINPFGLQASPAFVPNEDDEIVASY